MIDVITQAADFTKVLNAPCRSRSPHFAVHHLAHAPARKPGTRVSADCTLPPPDQQELSTEQAESLPAAVDESGFDRVWLGLVVPKKHARRAVTRTLLKRRIRAAVSDACGLPPGMWVVRLRSPFLRSEYRSAASERLAAVVAAELKVLMSAAVARTRQ